MDEFHVTKENWPDCPDGNNCMFCERYSAKDQERLCSVRRMRAKTVRRLRRAYKGKNKRITL